MENELKSYMSNVDEIVSLLKQKVERIEKERDEWKAKYDELHTKYDNILATESGHESKTENVWQSGYAAGHEAGSEKRITAAADKAVDFAMHINSAEQGSREDYESAYDHWNTSAFREANNRDLDESAAGITQDAHEKEVMMQAFDNVRQIFVGRQWIMEGRGSYPYNDDRYQQEVRYMYNEFDQVVKDTWANIKSKSADYRKAIIAEYLESAAGREEDACDFAEWMRLNCKSSQNGWVDALGKWDTTKGWYELFKQQK